MQLEILPTGTVKSGKVQAINIEKPVDEGCAESPIPANVATYTQASADPEPGGGYVSFLGGPNNDPVADLYGYLRFDGGAAIVALRFDPTDRLEPGLAWSVLEEVTLAAQ